MTKNTHGTGCTYSAAIAAGLARGLPVFEAVQQAKEYINTALAFALDIGGGHGPTHHLASLYRDRERYRLLQEMQAGVALLEGKAGLAALIPEVQSNLLAALPYARGPEDIAALPGRLVKWGERVRAVGLPTFGASRHMVAVLIPALEADPEVRAVMNIRYSPEIIAACEQAGLTVASFDRQEKPEDYAARPQNRYREWGTAAVIEEKGFVPDVIYDRGAGAGKPRSGFSGKVPGRWRKRSWPFSGSWRRVKGELNTKKGAGCAFFSAQFGFEAFLLEGFGLGHPDFQDPVFEGGLCFRRFYLGRQGYHPLEGAIAAFRAEITLLLDLFRLLEVALYRKHIFGDGHIHIFRVDPGISTMATTSVSVW